MSQTASKGFLKIPSFKEPIKKEAPPNILSRRKLRGSFLLFTLALSTLILVVALAIYKLRVTIIRNDFVRQNQVIRDMEAESLLNETYAEFLEGKRSPFEKLEKVSVFEKPKRDSLTDVQKERFSEEFDLSLTKISSREFSLEARAAFYEKALRFTVVPMSDFFLIYSKPKSFQYSDSKILLQGPLYAPGITFDLRNSSVEIYSSYKNSLPNLISGGKISVKWSGSNSTVSLSKIAGDFGRVPFRTKREDFQDDSFTGSKLIRQDLDLPLGTLFAEPILDLKVNGFQKSRSRQFGRDDFPVKLVLNPYLNRKRFLFEIGYGQAFSSADLKTYFPGGGNNPRLFIVPPSFGEFQDSDSFNPWMYIDSLGFEPSFDYSLGTLTFFDESRVYRLLVSEEMLVGTSEIKLYDSRTVAISVGRGIKNVSLNVLGGGIDYEYDRVKRTLYLKKSLGQFLAYGDGRKQDFAFGGSGNTSGVAGIFFVAGKKASYQFSSDQFGNKIVHFDQAPGYGKIIESINQTPTLYFSKEKIPQGSRIYMDPVEEALDIDLRKLERFAGGNMSPLIFNDSVFLSGETGGGMRIYSKKDVYLGDIRSSRALVVIGRLVFLDPQKKTEYRNLILATSGGELLPLDSSLSDIRVFGSFLFQEDLRAFGPQDQGPVGLFSFPDSRPSKIRLEYESDFVPSPSKNLLIYVRR